ncbi:MAG: ferrous iron transport protein B [Lachnospiraceae bacterium]|nr:ferrous iron transport protein B [Lachnospiraceae bacterium]
MTLDRLKIGKTARIISIEGEGSLKQHFLDMGLIPGAELSIVKTAPLGDPVEISIHGYLLTLRLSEAAKISVCETDDLSETSGVKQKKKVHAHPSLGEPGIHHDKSLKRAFPQDHILTFALVGNQNSGKTTLFNQLTGSNQHVGNFPGVTIDRKDGTIRKFKNTRITDLPGIYSMSPYSGEELVSRDFVLNEKPDAIINIVDATNIERNLYLTMQLLEMERPVVVAVNMMDELSGNGGSIDINIMESMLGVPVVPISAVKNAGVDELVTHAIHIAKYQEKPTEQDYCAPTDHEGAVHRCIHAVSSLIEDHAKRADIPVRFAASKAIEGDRLIIEKLQLDQNELETLEHLTLQMESESGMERAVAIADMRFDFIKRVCDESVTKPHESRERIRSEKLDRVLTGKYTAIPVFVGIMVLIFILTFNVIGAWLQGLIETGIGALSGSVEALLISSGANEVIRGLIVKGIIEGVGSVLSFMPIVVVMFFFLSILEDSGYIARVAFFMDTLLRKIGLSGRSIVPLLIGFGCSVPAVMSTRTLPSDRDRRMTILLTPFMSCTAKLPIYGFFVNIFFPGYGGLIMAGLYFLGILVGILVAFLFKKTLFKGEAVPFVMELPNYRLPGIKNTLQLMWEKAKDFIQRAFSIILIATVIVWFLKTFDLGFNLAADPSESILAAIANLFVPIMAPLGLGDWRICTSLISGFMAKESVVSVMGVLYTGAGVSAAMTASTAGAFLVFSLLYTPCIAAIASIRREMGGKWAVAVIVWQCAVAWGVTAVFRLIMLLFGAA